jgi:hypothetical protein
MALHTAGSVSHSTSSQIQPAHPLQLWEAKAPLPGLSLMKDLLGSVEWLGSSCQIQSWGHRGGNNPSACWKAVLRKAGYRD